MKILKVTAFFYFTLLSTMILTSSGQQPVKLATEFCLAKHDQISKHIEFRGNCKKEQSFGDADNVDKEKHSCFINRWYCAKLCTNNGKCSVNFILAFYLHIDQTNGKPIDLDCACGYDKCQKGCDKPTYLTDLQTVDEQFKLECSASCKLDVVIDGASVVYDSDGGLGTNATISCIELSSTLIGSPLLTCLSDEKWDLNPPYCQQGCSILIYDASILYVTYTQKYGNKVKRDGTATVNCVEPSSLLVGSQVLTCGDTGEWDNTFPDCKTGCTTFALNPAITIAYSLGYQNMVKYGGTASFKCTDDSATLVGESLLTCNGNEEWDNNEPSCISGCTTFAANSAVTITYSMGYSNKVKYGGTASFKCVLESSTLVGEALLTCNGNEQWDKKEPSCISGCTTFAVNSAVTITYSLDYNNMVKYGGTVSFKCVLESSTLVGEAFLTCNGNEQWDKNEPSCKPGCEKFTVQSGTNVQYSLEFGNKVKSGGTATFTCNPSLALVGTSKLTCTIQEQWDGSQPLCKIVEPYATQAQCLALKNSFYLNKKCFVRESLRDMSRNENQCIQLTSGQLLTQKTDSELTQIVNALKDTTTQYPPGTDRVFAVLTDNLKPGQTVRLQGHITNIKQNEIDIGNQDHIHTRIQLGGLTNANIIQHVALEVSVAHTANVVHLMRFPQINGNIGLGEFVKTVPIPNELQNDATFDMTITYRSDSQFEIKVGSFNQLMPFKDEQLHYINFVRFHCRVEPESITIDGIKELRTADDNDNLYTQCMVVGLYDKNRAMPPVDAKAGWVWENGDTADPTTTLWDITAGEPNNKFGDEHYACVNIFTYKLRDFPNYLKKYPICEYNLAG